MVWAATSRSMNVSQLSGSLYSVEQAETADPMSFPHGYSFTPGVVTTVEPGYYKEGDFGVRTESLFVCKEVEVSPYQHGQN